MSCWEWASNLPNVPGQALGHVLNGLLSHTFSGNLITVLLDIEQCAVKGYIIISWTNSVNACDKMGWGGLNLLLPLID